MAEGNEATPPPAALTDAELRALAYFGVAAAARVEAARAEATVGSGGPAWVYHGDVVRKQDWLH